MLPETHGRGRRSSNRLALKSEARCRRRQSLRGRALHRTRGDSDKRVVVAGIQCRLQLRPRSRFDIKLGALRLSFASLFPDVDRPLLGEAINLLELRVGESKFLHRIQ